MLSWAASSWAQTGDLADGFYLVVYEESEGSAWVRYRERDEAELVETGSLMSFADVAEASAAIDEMTEQPVVRLTLTRAGREQFAALSAAHVGDRFAVIIDGVVVTAPAINEPIKRGELQISGGFDLEGAAAIAERLSPR